MSRALFPNHRRTYVAAMVPMVARGADLFEPNEVGHPNTLFAELAPQFGVRRFVNRPMPLSMRDLYDEQVARLRYMHTPAVPMPFLPPNFINPRGHKP